MQPALAFPPETGPAEGCPAEPGPADPDAARWAAVRARDKAAAGAFVFAVITTGVYCRPGCASRRPRRENVRFFDHAAAARRAGYRACLRCRPDDAAETAAHAEAVAAACRLIETAETPPALDALAAASGLSRSHFHRLFKAATGVTPKAWAAASRRRRLATALGEGGSVTSAIFDAGFNSSSRFYAKSDRLIGMRASRFRDGGAGETIRYAVAATSLGTLLIAATGCGIAAVEFALDDQSDADQSDAAQSEAAQSDADQSDADRAGALEALLKARFPKAALTTDAEFEGWVAALVALVDRPRSVEAGNLPLDLAGTAFQARVWAALSAIPQGETLSYAALARAVGNPAAVRAVARACATNPVSILVPCHRAVGSDGSLTGYAWGLARKRMLLDREAAPFEAALSTEGESA